MKSKQINYSDIPALTDKELRSLKRPGRPLISSLHRKMVAIRLDQIVLKKLRQMAEKDGIGYQSLINEILAKHVSKG